MKGKREFSDHEANQIRHLINQKLMASKNEQKTIRNKIRSLGFYYSDFSSKKGYTIDDFNELIKTGEIIITDQKNVENITEKNIPETTTEDKNEKITKSNFENIERDLIKESNFKSVSELNQEILDNTGFYCIKLRVESKLTERYQNILDKREYKFLYIGKAEGQNLRERLEQELEHTSPGTFFRSIGCVLSYYPMKGHLRNYKKQYNFKFSPENTIKIIQWLKENVEINIVKFNGNFKIEKKLIRKYCPLLNDKNNPLKLQELMEDREECRKIAKE